MKSPFFYVIVIDLPKSIILSNGDSVVIKDENDNPVYEKNYFCRIVKHPKTGVVFNEWDTDARYAQRFADEVSAINFNSVIVKTDGANVEQFIPTQKQIEKPLLSYGNKNNSEKKR